MKDALRNGNFEAALKKLALDKGTGSDGKLPARRRQLRMGHAADGDDRQSSEDGQGCKDVEAEWKNFNATGDKAVAGVSGDVNSTEVANTIDSLSKLNNR